MYTVYDVEGYKIAEHRFLRRAIKAAENRHQESLDRFRDHPTYFSDPKDEMYWVYDNDKVIGHTIAFYRKSRGPVPLDTHGDPVEVDDKDSVYFYNSLFPCKNRKIDMPMPDFSWDSNNLNFWFNRAYPLSSTRHLIKTFGNPRNYYYEFTSFYRRGKHGIDIHIDPWSMDNYIAAVALQGFVHIYNRMNWRWFGYQCTCGSWTGEREHCEGEPCVDRYRQLFVQVIEALQLHLMSDAGIEWDHEHGEPIEEHTRKWEERQAKINAGLKIWQENFRHLNI